MPKSINIQLSQTRIERNGSRDSLGDLLKQVADIMHPNHDDEKWGDQCKKSTIRYVSRWAIRAMCEEIIRTGGMWSPPEVSFTHFWCKRAKGFRFQASRN
jgi:hypothetical protein